jgi:hypothetical protein
VTTRVFSTYVSTTTSTNATIVARRARLKSFVLYNNGASDGLYTFKDGSASGTTLVQVMVKAGDTVDHFIHDMGIEAPSSGGLHLITPTSGGFATVFYD